MTANRLEEAKAVFDEAVQRKFYTENMHDDRALVAFMEEQWKWDEGWRTPYNARAIPSSSGCDGSPAHIVLKPME
jgi:hypothetical protein